MAPIGNDGSPPADARPRLIRQTFLPPEFVELVAPPLKVGFYSGTKLRPWREKSKQSTTLILFIIGIVGVLAGVGGAIARDTSPVVSGFLSGTQWFMLGSTFWFTRTVGFKAFGNHDRMNAGEKVAVSGFAGSTAGAVTGLARGPTRILPAMIIWGLAGAGGQLVANKSASSLPKDRTKYESSWLSKLSPLKKLSDEEYIQMMEEKLLKVEVDIALIDDRIAELRVAGQAKQAKDAEDRRDPTN